ncbi:phosphonate C-P lyase system protein PhnG [Marinobacter fonticola]|uniref:phosphonate C-P lyase system protein PhnG n=1 Tax=Marinobacter fonticola TaxID=2603215 RepID=UPI0011E7C100|nr:phosphonate C-P lyase system protein PhnG [Marinobacter fonticola]
MTQSQSHARQGWMAVLSRASIRELEDGLTLLDSPPAYRHLRPPECGMAMVRGRTGGNGGAFNLGEVTVTRCALSLDDGTTGMSWVLGRDKRHAELAALFDALLQTGRYDELQHQLIEPCRGRWQAAQTRKTRQAAATKVDFFTMVRGENA